MENGDGKLGARLRELRRARGLTQVDVAAALDVSRSHLTQIELGSDPGFAMFCALADFYDVSLDYLYRGTSAVDGPDPQDIAHNEEERVLLRIWRTVGDVERHSLMVLLRAQMVANSDAA